VGRVRGEGPVSVLDGGEELDDGVGDGLLQRPVAGGGVLGFDVRDGLVGGGGEDLEQVGYAGLGVGIEADVGAGVGHGGADPLAQHVGRVEEADGARG
jgi:hypothetical protein